jgi:amidase
MAANYAAAAIGTETSGSIVSPSSQNSIVGLKPTIGLLSRSGIVPISSTLDTPGPMTRNITDNAILLSAITGEDTSDAATKDNPKDIQYYKDLKKDYVNGLRLGAFKNYMDDSLYTIAINDLKDLGAEIVEIDAEQVSFSQFITFLNADMQRDFPKYMSSSAGPEISITTVEDVVNYNLEDTLVRAPYGQALFEGVVAEKISDEDFEILKTDYDKMGKSFFNTPMDTHNLDAILSINNYNSGHAAMAKYPCLTVPMGYETEGQPKNITFIAKTYQEDKLLKIGYAYEQATQKRKTPENYKK